MEQQQQQDPWAIFKGGLGMMYAGCALMILLPIALLVIVLVVGLVGSCVT